jgi:hypothetical protein
VGQCVGVGSVWWVSVWGGRVWCVNVCGVVGVWCVSVCGVVEYLAGIVIMFFSDG